MLQFWETSIVHFTCHTCHVRKADLICLFKNFNQSTNSCPWLWYFSALSMPAYSIMHNMTVPPWPDTIGKKKRRHVALSPTLPFMSPHLAAESLRPASPHQIEARRQTHIHFIPEGVADSAKEHICPVVFTTIPIYSCPPSLICHHLTVKTQGAMTPVFTVKGWRDTYSPLHTREFTCMAEGYSRLIDVLVGVMTQEVELNHCEKVCIRVGAHNISNLWSFPFTEKERRNISVCTWLRAAQQVFQSQSESWPDTF